MPCRDASMVSGECLYLRSGASWQVQLHGLLDRVRLVMVLNSKPLGSNFSLLLSRCSDLMAVTPVNAPSENWGEKSVGTPVRCCFIIVRWTQTPLLSRVFWISEPCTQLAYEVLTLLPLAPVFGSDRKDGHNEGISPVFVWHESLLSSFPCALVLV